VRRVRRDAVRLPALAQSRLCRGDGARLRYARMALPFAGGADHARHRRGDALRHAPELAGLALSPHAEHAGPAVVVARDAGLVLPFVHRGGPGPRHPGRYVDLEGLAPPAPDDAALVGRADHVLVAGRLPRVSPG